jgi:hypothetical protein
VTSIGNGAFLGCDGFFAVIFENTRGWYAADKLLKSSELNDCVIAKDYLTKTYTQQFWKRR